jgi:hypothetical protein
LAATIWKSSYEVLAPPNLGEGRLWERALRSTSFPSIQYTKRALLSPGRWLPCSPAGWPVTTSGARVDPSDVYALGANGWILHFDGSAWTQLHAPGAPDDAEGFTGLHVQADGQVLIAGAGPGPVGRILQGGPAGLTELTRCDVAPRDLVAVGARLLLPVGSAGVAELTGRSVTVVKSNCDAVAASAGAGRAYFIEAVQQRPSFIEHDPSEEHPWIRLVEHDPAVHAD